MREHQFVKVNGKMRCANCGLEYDPTDDAEIIANVEMSDCPEADFTPEKAIPATASIDENRPWIRYEADNEGNDPVYYRDYLDDEGNLCYCEGEECLVHPWQKPEEHQDSILMSNECSDIPYFVIPREQFIADFGEAPLELLHKTSFEEEG